MCSLVDGWLGSSRDDHIVLRTKLLLKNQEAGMRALELKIPPLALVLLTAAVMWLSARTAPTFTFVYSTAKFHRGCNRVAGSGHEYLRCRVISTCWNDGEPAHSGRIIFVSPLWHLHTQPKPDVSRISAALARMGNLSVERSFSALHSCVCRLHEPLSNRTRGKCTPESFWAGIR